MKLSVSIGLIVFLAMAGQCIAGDPVGWRTDWTGKYPAADPPLRWSATENVVWKTPMPGWSNSTPVIVGDRVLVCSEPTTLVCVALDDGRILWQKATTYFDAMPADEAARLKKLADEINVDKTHRELRSAQGKISRLDTQLKRASDGLEKARKEAEEKKDDAALAERIATLEKQVAEARKQLEEQKPALEAQAAETRKKLEPVKELLLPETHGVNGYSSPTPVSDGRYVYVFYTTGVVSCFDLEGNRKWATMTEKPKLTYGVSASPLLADGKVIVHPDSVHALDAETGQDLWQQKSKPLWGSPVVAEVGGRKVVITNSGDWFLAADGRQVASRAGKASYNQPIVADGVVYFIESGGAAYRLPAKIGDKPERLWQTKPPSPRYYASPVIHEGLIYDINEQHVMVIIDAGTGEVIEQQKLNLGRNQVYPSIALAGKYLYVSGPGGTTAILEPGRTIKEVARNTLEDFRSTPVFQGKRMYVRTMKHLYCIGQ